MKLFIRLMVLIISLVYLMSSNAEEVAAVNVGSCGKMVNTTKPFILALTKNQPLVSSILQCVDNASLPSAAVMGIGMVHNPKMAYFNPKTKRYQSKNFSGDYELLNLSGNITKFAGQNFPHIHIVIGDQYFKVYGGHLEEAKVGIKAEIVIFPFQTKIISADNVTHQYKLIVTDSK